ncbi:MAG: AAC(3) family N-acetyltransferase [Gemmatimonadetes bacterium]|nr:AAC(3) family N-acetyltransferase [Gemmatimonadota bacterium]
MSNPTRESLRRDLHALGVPAGVTLIVHSSLKAAGWVEGGPKAVIDALRDIVGPEGTLVMPAATPQCSDPAHIYDHAETPTRMGAIPETFRNAPGTLRSHHPLESVAAAGPAAANITRTHPTAFSEGEGSPWERLAELDARILLLGVGFNRCTALHHAESLVPNRRVMSVRFPARGDDGSVVWHETENVADDNGRHFPEIGRRYLAAGRATSGRIGEAESTLIRMRDLVEFAVEYFRGALPGSGA